MHHIVLPISGVFAPVGPDVGACALHLIFDKVAVESAAIGPLKATYAVLLTLGIFAFVDSTVFPRLLAQAMVQVIDPQSLVRRPIVVRVGSHTIHLVVFPVS